MTREIDTYTDNDLETICPNCGHKQKHDAESLSYTDGEEDTINCYSCEKQYIATVSVRISRESKKIEERLV